MARCVFSFVKRKSFAAGVLLALALFGRAERLPIRTYSTADGLPHNVINRIFRDSRGFLWFCTDEGLARFDGYSFISYGTEQGLPSSGVNDILETRAGEFWVATKGGLVHFNPKGAPAGRTVKANEAGPDSPAMFITVLPEEKESLAHSITAILEASDGTLWCGTLNGLYRLEAGSNALLPVDVGILLGQGELAYVNDVIEDRFGSLWVATPNGLYRRWRDGSAVRYSKREGLPNNFISDLFLDHQGRLWVGTHDAGIFRLDADETHARPIIAFTLVPHDYVQSEWINQIFETSDHKLWAATARGLMEFAAESDSGGRSYRLYTPKNGLSDHNVSALAEDAGGNLWLGSTNGTGVMRLTHNGFVTYDSQDGVIAVNAIFADRAGGVCFRGYVMGDKRASIFDGGKVDLLKLSEATFWLRFGRFDGRRLTWFVPDVLRNKSPGWVSEGVTLQSRSGEWWITMGEDQGAYRFPRADDLTQLKTAQPLAAYGKDTVLGQRQIWRVFEDSHQRVWISTVSSNGNGLAQWERDTDNLRDLTEAVNLPSLRDDLVRSFGEDRSGNVWLGFNTGVARWHDGVFTFFNAQQGLPPGGVEDIYTDHAGRLWLASSRGGLVRIEHPEAASPDFKSYTTEQGLSGNFTLALAEDSYGRVYVGTGRGLDRLDPETGRVKHYTTADGLASGKIIAIFPDRDGYLWVGTSQGLSRFLIEPDQQTPPPPVLVTGVQMAGASQHVSALGETNFRLPDLPAGATQLQIDFVGLGFAPGESLRYQYMLEGADHAWSVPSTQRTVTYARLAAGRYRFLVRAVNADGEISSTPAVVTFQVLPPLWLRWWFIALMVMAIAGAAFLVYRFRVRRLLEVANMRTRIATDLHDDIGANLTRISILSEVAKQQFGNGNQPAGNPLTSIAEIARESVTSMSDIVWAINPERDSLRDLVRRMRQHADELFTLRDIDLEFNAPAQEQELKLGVNLRRDLLLIFKEAVSNAARHSNCSRVVVDFQADHHELTLRITDNGVGFEPNSEKTGHGLVSMLRRAQKLGGAFSIDSQPGRGTTVRAAVALKQIRRRS